MNIKEKENNKIVEIQIRKVEQLSDAGKKEVEEKLKNLPESYDFRGYVKVSYTDSPALRIVSVDPIQGTIYDYLETMRRKIRGEVEK